MVRVKAEVIDKKLKNIIITGDFFAYPESLIEDIEKSLIGILVDFPYLKEKIDDIIESKKANLLGLESKHLAEAIIKATE